MKKTFAIVMLLALASLVMVPAEQGWGARVEDLNKIKEGFSIPAFKGRTITGEEVDVGELLGKKALVLAFWSIYCKPCVEEISSLIKLQEEFGNGKLEVIGINADSELDVSRIRTFMDRFEEFEKKKINYRNIYDEGNQISKLLGVGFLPTVLSVNLQGQVEKVFVGFEDESEREIFAGIKKILPVSVGTTEEIPGSTQDFSVEAVSPLCGFYGSDGWIANFSKSTDREAELEKAAIITNQLANKLILKEALLALGVSLAEGPEYEGCVRPYGIYLMEDPLDEKDCLTNLLRELPGRLIKDLESQEDFLDTEYRVSKTASVDLTDLRDALDTLGYRIPSRTVTFSVVNVNKLDQTKFEKLLLQQSRYIGYFSFPTYTIYTTTENFADEMNKMDLGNLKLFIEETSEERIELEVWQ